MNTCACEERLTSWLLGDLPPPEAEAIRLHVAACDTCRARVDELAPVVAALRQGLTAAPATPLRLYPARRRRVLATPYRTRFRSWWVASHPGLRAAAMIVVFLGLVLPTLLTARRSACYSAKSARNCEVELMECEALQDAAPPDTTDRSDQSDRSDLSWNSGAAATRLHRESGTQPAEITFTPEIAITTPEPPPAPPPASPQPQSFDAVMQVKSPMILRNVFGSTRSAGLRGAGAAIPDDDIQVEVNLPETIDRAEAAKEKHADADGDALFGLALAERKNENAPSSAAEGKGSLADAEKAEQLARLREDIAMIEDHATSLSGKISELRGDPPPSAKPPARRSLEKASESELLQRQAAAAGEIERLSGSIKDLLGKGPVLAASGEAPASAPVGEREAVPEPAGPAKPKSQIVAGRVVNGDYAHYASDKNVIAGGTAGEKQAEIPASEITSEEATLRKMKTITIPEIDFRIANIKDIAYFFKEASREYGPAEAKDGKVLDFVVKGLPGEQQQGQARTPDDPFAPVGSQSADANGSPPITFSARYINLYEAAKIIADVAGLKMRVSDNQVVFQPLNAPECDMVTRSYDVTGTLAAKIKGFVTDTGPTDITQLFSDTGVSPPEGTAIIYVPSIGKLRATLTPESHAEFERTLNELNAAPLPEGDVEEKTSPDARVPAAHNPFVATRANPFSTFAIDVDTASYTLTRQALTGGALPDPETVRTEEIVNAFDYGDRAPENAVFRVYIEGAPAPFGAGLDLLRIGVKGRRLGREEQRPARLTFLVDASGSMDQPDRIGLARQALTLLLEQLAPQDRLQLIAFDDRARLLLEPTSPADRAAILAAFDRLQCRGSTNLEDGMREAYALAARAFLPGGENRVILISDGVANLGTDSAADILANIEAHRRQGITCTVFGVGRGAYNDRMLEELANRGDGSYRFLDSPEEVRRAFVDDLAATLNTIATDVKIQVEWDPAAVSRYRQLGYENRALTKEQFRDDTVDAGEVGSGQSVTALYEFERAEPAARNRPLGMVRVRYRRVDTQAIEEIEQPILPRQLAPQIEAARPELRLAASAAEFAELLRRSPYAAGNRFVDVVRLLHPVALEMKLDTRVGELLRLVEMAQGMGD
jgi:Ca-activated chloride channel family protein